MLLVDLPWLAMMTAPLGAERGNSEDLIFGLAIATIGLIGAAIMTSVLIRSLVILGPDSIRVIGASRIPYAAIRQPFATGPSVSAPTKEGNWAALHGLIPSRPRGARPPGLALLGIGAAFLGYFIVGAITMDPVVGL